MAKTMMTPAAIRIMANVLRERSWKLITPLPYQ
jgi:hypothetical protein